MTKRNPSDSSISLGIALISAMMNSFGMDFAQAKRKNPDLRAASQSMAELDSDGDTRANVEEILAGTNPGAKN